MRRRFVRFLIASARLLPDERESIWSIPRPLQVVYFPLFIGICIPLLIDTVKEVTALHPEAGLVTVARETAAEFAAVAVGTAIVTLLAVQGGYIVMMAIYHAITNRFTKPVIEEHIAQGREIGREEGREIGREEGREIGREEGIAEGVERANESWTGWNQRRLAHEAQGLPFDEPPPGQPPSRNGKEE